MTCLLLFDWLLHFTPRHYTAVNSKKKKNIVTGSGKTITEMRDVIHNPTTIEHFLGNSYCSLYKNSLTTLCIFAGYT
jgi:hypothetical protein